MVAETGATTSRLLNRMAYDLSNKASDISTAATGDLILISDVSADGAMKTGDGANILEMIGSTVTAAEMNYLDIATLGTGAASKAVVLDASGDYTFPATATIVMPASGTAEFQASSTLTLSGAVVQAPVFVADATPYTVLAANSGKMHIILEQTSSITLNLPVIAAGLSYKFVMGGVATEAQNWVIVATTPSFWNGGIVWTDLNDAENNIALVYGNGTSHLTLTVTTPGAGTEIEVFSNGTEWFVHGAVVSDSTPAFT